MPFRVVTLVHNCHFHAYSGHSCQYTLVLFLTFNLDNSNFPRSSHSILFSSHYNKTYSCNLINSSVSTLSSHRITADSLTIVKKEMLPASIHPSAQAATILDLASDNWAQVNKAFTLSCYTKFGVAGQQILSNTEIPQTPSAGAPNKQDVDTNIDGTPIPWQFTIAAEAESEVPSLTSQLFP